jgi:hypothetical protein
MIPAACASLRPLDSDQRHASMTATDAFHLTCGASLGPRLPYLHGGEPVALQNIHPSRRKGRLNQTQPSPRPYLPEELERMPRYGSNGMAERGKDRACRSTEIESGGPHD